MKRILLGSVGLVALMAAGSANAADIAAPVYKAPPVAPVCLSGTEALRVTSV